MPLIDNSEYSTYLRISKGAQIAAGGDPHETLAHVVLATNPDSEVLKQYAAFLSNMAAQVKVNPLSWLGNAVAVYVDSDPIWLEAANADSTEMTSGNDLCLHFGELGRLADSLTCQNGGRGHLSEKTAAKTKVASTFVRRRSMSVVA